MSIYQIGQLRKSAGLAEAVHRGLKIPLLQECHKKTAQNLKIRAAEISKRLG